MSKMYIKQNLTIISAIPTTKYSQLLLALQTLFGFLL